MYLVADRPGGRTMTPPDSGGCTSGCVMVPPSRVRVCCDHMQRYALGAASAVSSAVSNQTHVSSSGRKSPLSSACCLKQACHTKGRREASCYRLRTRRSNSRAWKQDGTSCWLGRALDGVAADAFDGS